MPFSGYDRLNGTFAQRLQALISAAPGPITVVSGHRTREEQAQLYQQKGPRLAARPGHSNHEKGLAADLRFASEAVRRWVHTNAGRYGLSFPMSWEPWHIEPLGLREGNFDPDAYSSPGAETPEAPEDRLPRLFSMVLGQPTDGRGPLDEILARFTTKQGAKAETRLGTGPLGVEGALRLARAAGFEGEALVTAVAVAMAESRLNPQAAGDRHLADRTWGPSLGLWQVRSLNAERGTGGWRDAAQLTDPAFNARAAYAISGGGTNFKPWMVYKTGAYRQYLGEVRAALGRAGV